MVLIKNLAEIEIMAEGGRRLARVVDKLTEKVKIGTTTKELDELAESMILALGDECSFKGYGGYPNCLCTSVNEKVVHVIPSDYALREGDIISLDLGLKHKGYHSDMAVTLPVGKVGTRAAKLMKVTKKALRLGIKEVKVGNYIGDISRTIQRYVEGAGFSIVRELCGHGIGKDLHEAPLIFSFVSLSKDTVDKVEFTGEAKIKIKEGMVLCLEPIVSMGNGQIKETADGFGYETIDGSWTSHFEHTVAVLSDGVKILTMLK